MEVVEVVEVVESFEMVQLADVVGVVDAVKAVGGSGCRDVGNLKSKERDFRNKLKRVSARPSLTVKELRGIHEKHHGV